MLTLVSLLALTAFVSAASTASALTASTQCSASPANIAKGTLTATDGCAYFHEVQVGETCESILGIYPTALDLASFYQANPSINDKCTNLVPGTSVCVTGPIQLSCGSLDLEDGCVKFRAVKKGDTCQSIVDEFKDITLADFYRFNPQVDPKCSNLIAGLQYCTCDGGKGVRSPMSSPVKSPSAAPVVSAPTDTEEDEEECEEEEEEEVKPVSTRHRRAMPLRF